MRRARAVLAVGTVAAAMSVLGAQAVALEPSAHGWWNRRNDGPTAPVAVAPPDVPEDGLYAAGGPAGPEAVAAVAYALPAGERADRLTLEVAGAGISGGLAACTITGGVEPVQNGPWADVPRYDDRACVLAGPPEDDAVRFELADLGLSDSVALALVPTSPASRAVFAAPGPASLTTVADPSASAPSAPPPTAAWEPPPAAAAAPGAGDPALPPPSATSGPGVAPAFEAAEEEVAAGAPRLFRRVSDGGSDRQRAVGGIVGGALFFAVLVFYSVGYGPLGARYGR